MKIVQSLFALVLVLSLSGCIAVFDKMPHKKWGFIDKSGKTVIEAKFDDVIRDQYGGCTLYHKPFRNFSEGLCAVRVKDKWGYIDKTGAFLVTPVYDNAGNFSEGLACVRSGTKYGYIDKTGKLAIPLELDFNRDTAGLSNNNPDWDFTQVMIEPLEFSEGLAVCQNNGKYGYINKRGEFAIAPQFLSADPFHQKLASVRTSEYKSGNGKTYIDQSGKVIIKGDENCYDFNEGIFVKGNGKYDASRRLSFLGENESAFGEFQDARIFSEGLAAVAPDFNKVQTGGAYGYIDKTGKMVIAAQFDISGNNLAANFQSGKAIVSTNSLSGSKLHGIIDKSGKWIIPCQYEHISAFRDGMFRAFSNNKCIYLDENGKTILTPNTPWGNSFSEGFAAVMEP